MASADEHHVREIIAGLREPAAPRGRFPQMTPIAFEARTFEADNATQRIVDDYFRYGYALVRCQPRADDGARLLKRLAETIGLGQPFVPALYAAGATSGYYDSGVNVITVEVSDARGPHPAFGSTDAIELHTDGTLEPIGLVRTAALYCVTSAHEGGRTTLFHAVDAFVETARRDPTLAAALLHDEVLTRRATVGDAPRSSTGPVFALRDGEIVSRYSTTPRDQWAVDRVDRLDAARRALAELARPGSPYYAEHALEPGDAILIANDKLSHGRTAFVDHPGARRRMLRALFLDRPACQPTAPA